MMKLQEIICYYSFTAWNHRTCKRDGVQSTYLEHVGIVRSKWILAAEMQDTREKAVLQERLTGRDSLVSEALPIIAEF